MATEEQAQQHGVDSVKRTMKHTNSAKPEKPVSLKKLDDPASKDFWDFVKKSTQEWRERQPDWSRELDRDRRSGNDRRDDDRTADTQRDRRVR